MKRIYCVILTLALALGMAACGGKAPEMTTTETPLGTTEAQTTTQAPTSEIPTTQAPTESATTQVTTEAPTVSVAREYPDNIMAHYRLSNDEGMVVVFGSDSLRRADITEISFLDTLDNMPGSAWDVSESQDGRVMAWTEGSHLYIAGNGGVTLPANCNCLFSDFENVTRINFNDCMYTDLVVDWNGFFNYCVSLESLDLSFFNTASAEKMANLFNHCESLTTLDVSNFDTRRVRTMSQMFCGCSALEELVMFTTSSPGLHSCMEMFSGCSGLTSLDLRAMVTGNVTNFCAMFNKCSGLTQLDLSGFDFSQAERTDSMFYGCTGLTDINCTITVPDGCDTESMYDGSGLNG